MDTEETEEIERIFTDKGIVFRIFFSKAFDEYKSFYVGNVIGYIYNIMDSNYVNICYIKGFGGDTISDIYGSIEHYIMAELNMRVVKRLSLANSYFSE